MKYRLASRLRQRDTHSHSLDIQQLHKAYRDQSFEDNGTSELTFLPRWRTADDLKVLFQSEIAACPQTAKSGRISRICFLNGLDQCRPVVVRSKLPVEIDKSSPLRKWQAAKRSHRLSAAENPLTGSFGRKSPTLLKNLRGLACGHRTELSE